MTTTTVPNVLPVSMPGDQNPTGRDRLLLVADPVAGAVAVRWELGRVPMWRCKPCGPQYEVECAHTFAAALRLAQDLLGLEPTHPIPDGATAPDDTTNERNIK